jgi:hypothetical protein
MTLLFLGLDTPSLSWENPIPHPDERARQAELQLVLHPTGRRSIQRLLQLHAFGDSTTGRNSSK